MQAHVLAENREKARQRRRGDPDAKEQRGLLAGVLSKPDGSGMTALHYAVLAPYVVAVDLLLRAGANVNARNQTGSTPLLLATIKAHHSLVVMLLREGAQPDLPDRDGHTPLMVASRAGWTETVKALLDANAASEAVDTHNHTALWYAQKFEQKGCIVLLKKAKKATKSSRAKR